MKDIQEHLERLHASMKKRKRYSLEAYQFLLEALTYTVSRLDKPRHITGQELSEGIRLYALEQFGPMARRVLGYWGIQKTQDFGVIVFTLIDAGLLRKQPQDKLRDFRDVYDFEQAFDKGYQITED